jgi:phage terminase large subunit
MSEQIWVPYRPRALFMPYHNRTQRWAVLVVHRRAGKTVACINDLIMGAMTCPHENPRFHYIAPLLKQAKSVVWDYLKKYALVIPGTKANESELRVDFPNGGQVRLHGADNPDSLRGIYSDGVVLDEPADMRPRLFTEIIRPALSDREGWATWIGTPKGENDFHDLWLKAKAEPDEYFTLLARASLTGLVKPEELRSARQMMTPEQYLQEYECSWTAAIVGAYYGREMEHAEQQRRIVTDLYDPGLQVHTAWDLGIGDHTVIWMYQQDAQAIRLIDYYAAAGYGFDHYAEVLQSKRYKWGQHYLPHDVQVKELGTGKSRIESLSALGITATVVRKLSVEDGINAVRRILPRCWFDRDKCAEGIKAMRQYKRDWDDQRKVFYERPNHDWASHPADAFRYLAVGLDEPSQRMAIENLPERDMSWVV